MRMAQAKLVMRAPEVAPKVGAIWERSKDRRLPGSVSWVVRGGEFHHHHHNHNNHHHNYQNIGHIDHVHPEESLGHVPYLAGSGTWTCSTPLVLAPQVCLLFQRV